MELHGKKILVTGAGGFVGSHLVEELVRRGHDVRAFVRYNSAGSLGWLEQSPPDIRTPLEVFAGDVRDPHGVRTALEGCDVVFHLAALIAIPYSYHSPDSYVDTNVKGTLNVVQAARDLGLEKVVHTSTSEVYGTGRSVPISEEHPLQGQSPYSATKIGADQLAMSFHYAFGTPVAIIRPFNTYGPRQSARAIIPTVITQLASGSRVVKLGALHPTRDFIYVRDSVKAFIAVAESDRSVGEVIGVGGNFEISMGEVARLVAEVMGIQIAIELEEDRLRPPRSEVQRLWCDNSKAKRLLSWEPAFGGRDGLRRGLEETVKWFLEPENLKLYKPQAYNI